MDDWEVYHNDPHHAFSFLDRVFDGCHDLMRLEEYELAGKIVDKVCCLEFQVVDVLMRKYCVEKQQKICNS